MNQEEQLFYDLLGNWFALIELNTGPRYLLN
jgi:hypothetical protein